MQLNAADSGGIEHTVRVKQRLAGLERRVQHKAARIGLEAVVLHLPVRPSQGLGPKAARAHELTESEARFERRVARTQALLRVTAPA